MIYKKYRILEICDGESNTKNHDGIVSEKAPLEILSNARVLFSSNELHLYELLEDGTEKEVMIYNNGEFIEVK